MNLEEETGRRWTRLIETEAIVLTGGTLEEPEYHFNLEILEQVDPELYQMYLDDLDELLLSLASKGFLDIEMSGDEVTVSLTEKGNEIATALNELGFH